MNRYIQIKFFLLILAIVPLALTGCVAQIGPGGAAPGLIVSNVTYPNELNPTMNHRIVFDRDDIEILQPVEAESVSKWYLFLWSTGDSGYANLMRQVKEIGGDGVMNVTVDTNYKSFLIFYAEVHTQLTGLAYRYKRTSDYEEK